MKYRYEHEGKGRWGLYIAGAILSVLAAVSPVRSQQGTDDLVAAQGEAKKIVAKAKSTLESQAGRERRQMTGAIRPLAAADELFGRCSGSARKDFLRSLVFVDGKLGSAHVAGIEGCSEGFQQERLSAFFNMAADYKDYWCKSRATCSESAGSICTSNCRGGGSDPKPYDADPGYVSFANVLEGCPEQAANAFLDSVVVADGRLRSVSLEGLGSCAGKVKASCASFGREMCPGPNNTCVECRPGWIAPKP